MTMSTLELGVVAGLFTFFILLPVITVIVVRRFVPLEEPVVEGEEANEPVQPITSLRDLWEGITPHLLELRDRLTKAMIGVGIGAIIGAWMVYGAPLGKPLPDLLIDQFVPAGINLQQVGTSETFVAYMGIALVVGIAFGVPVIAYQIVAFLAPGLRPTEKRALYTALPFVAQLFLAGLAFGWFFTVPAAIGFLLNFNPSERVFTQPSLSNFLNTVGTLMLWNGVVFELPALVYLLARLGWVTRAQLASTRRYAIVVITIIAALITPTGDPFNLMLLAVPMYLLYEIGIFLTRFVPKRADPVEEGAVTG